GTAAAEIFPVIAVARTDAGHAPGLEMIAVELRPDFRHQLRCFRYRCQHFIESEGSIGPCRRCGERDERCESENCPLDAAPDHNPHDRNSRVYCVSCRMLARSARKVALPRSSSNASSARFAV